MKSRSRTIELELQVDTRQMPSYGRMLGNQPAPAMTILHHPRLSRIGERVLLPELLEVDEQVEVSRLGPDFVAPAGHEGLPLATHFLSRKPVLLVGRPEGAVLIDA